MATHESFSARQRARNEVFFREVNERIREVASTNAGEDLIVLCECGRQDCLEQVDIPVDDYEAVRGHATWFIVIPGHVTPEIEEVVTRDGGFLVVEKLGAAAEVAEREQPGD